MVPEFNGRPAQIQAYAARLLDRRDDVEASICVGFAVYTLALSTRSNSALRSRSITAS